MEKNAITSITTKKLNPWLEHVKAYKLEHPEVSLKSVLTEARKTYKTVKTVKRNTTEKKATESKTTDKKARRQVVKKNVDNPDEQQLLKVLQRRLELDQQQTPAVTKKTTPKRGKTTASKKTNKKKKATESKRVQRSKKNIEDYTEDEQDSNEIIDV
jgi:hypothetical protein